MDRTHVYLPNRGLIGALLIANMLMAARLSFSIKPLVLRSSYPLISHKHFPKSRPFPLWSSSFSFCLQKLNRSPTCPSVAPFSSHCSAPSMATAPQSTPEVNPLLQDFDFPPFDAVKADHVIPGIRTILSQLPDKVKFMLRLGQSKPFYNAFKAIQESPEWPTLSDAQKRIVESQIKEAILDGVSLEDDKKEHFNKIQQDSVEIETSTYSDFKERRETTSSSELCVESDDLESMAKPLVANHRHRSTVEKMPSESESELKEFFGVAEKEDQKRFLEKYNYDFVKDVPLEGRYEWVRFKP